jgi:hypothetical protein
MSRSTGLQILNLDLVAKNFISKFYAKINKVFTGSSKNCKMLEVKPKKPELASYGDFRGYLYEAPIFPMPVH